MRLSTFEVAHAQSLTQLHNYFSMSICEQTRIDEVCKSGKTVLLSSGAAHGRAEATIMCRIARSCPSRAHHRERIG